MPDLEEAMTTVLCTCRVADFEAWRPGYDKALEMFADKIRSWRVWRGQDDPNVIVIEETFDSREAAEGLWTGPATKAAMEADGVDMESVRIEYLDEVGSSTG
jgi:quinol monooxygenase YgiN